MSLSKRMATQDNAQPRSTWIEWVGLPLAYSVMVAQPLGLAVALLTLLVAPVPTAFSILIGQIALASLVLLWWALFVERLSATREWGKAIVSWLHVAGWFVVLLLAISPHLLPLLKGQDKLDVIVAVILVTHLWRRGISFARIGFEYADLATSFNICLGCLLVLLLIAIALPQAKGVLTALEAIVPLFFLSGMVSLSLARLSRIRTTRLTEGSQADPSRAWLFALAALGCVILVLVLVVNALFSFSAFEWLLGLLMPVWDVLGMIVTWLLYGLIFLLTPLFDLLSFLIGLIKPASPLPQNIHPVRPLLPNTQISHSLPPVLITVGQWVFLALLVLLLLLIVRKSMQRWLRGDEESSVEEERENISVRSVLRDRWQEWWKQHNRQFLRPLEALESTSMRARYRALLRAIAAADTTLARHSDETPYEYEERLARHAKEQEPSEQDGASNTSILTWSAMLHAVTDAYTAERYGQMRIDDQQLRRLASWIPLIILNVTGKTSGQASRRRDRTESPER